IRLSKQSRVIDLAKRGLYQLVLEFCVALWPDEGIFGPGAPEERYLAPVGMVRNHSYVEHNGLRYGSFHHTSGKGYCYGYIDGRYPVRVERILDITIPGVPGTPNLNAICIVVCPFLAPAIEPRFPWDTW
ncbi:hypothetical protein BDV93DRAFT_452284, partial [Ceratobasidium sp. AG-I]